MGISGLVIAAIFAAAMGTLASSLNASASSTVNDLYRPLVPNADEAHLVRVSKGMTAAWGVVKMGVAYGATGLKGNVVSNALAIASFVTGIILGVFLLGILTKRVGQSAALLGLLAGIAAVTYAKFGTLLAWPWYALVGSSTVFLTGLAAMRQIPSTKSLPKQIRNSNSKSKTNMIRQSDADVALVLLSGLLGADRRRARRSPEAPPKGSGSTRNACPGSTPRSSARSRRSRCRGRSCWSAGTARSRMRRRSAAGRSSPRKSR